MHASFYFILISPGFRKIPQSSSEKSISNKKKNIGDKHRLVYLSFLQMKWLTKLCTEFIWKDRKKERISITIHTEVITRILKTH